MNDKPGQYADDAESDNHIPILKDAVIPGEQQRRPEPVITPDTFAQFADPGIETAPARPQPLIQGAELEAIMDQAMETLRLELDQRISGIIRQALDDTIRSTLHQQEELLKQRLITHLEQRVSDLVRTHSGDYTGRRTTPGSDPDQAGV